MSDDESYRGSEHTSRGHVSEGTAYGALPVLDPPSPGSPPGPVVGGSPAGAPSRQASAAKAKGLLNKGGVSASPLSRSAQKNYEMKKLDEEGVAYDSASVSDDEFLTYDSDDGGVKYLKTREFQKQLQWATLIAGLVCIVTTAGFLMVAGVTYWVAVAGMPDSHAMDQSTAQEKRAMSTAYLEWVNSNLEVTSGGNPALDHPEFVGQNAEGAAYVNENDEVFVFRTTANTNVTVVFVFPLKVLNYHMVVNYQGPITPERFSFTYDPLTAAAMVYPDVVMGVSKWVYNSNIVLMDWGTGTRVPQMLGVGVYGSDFGKHYRRLQVSKAPWSAVRAAYPDTAASTTLLLARPTDEGNFDYETDPYKEYAVSETLRFPVAARNDYHGLKMMYHGSQVNQRYIAFLRTSRYHYTAADPRTYPQNDPPSTLNVFFDELGSMRTVLNDPTNTSPLDIVDFVSFDCYWFAWYAYNPDTMVAQLSSPDAD